MTDLISYPPLSAAGNEGIARRCAQILGREMDIQGVGNGTEAGIISIAGTPTIICGPGDTGRAHKANEWIGLDGIADGDRLLTRLAG